jgi:hypothetical protein
VQVTIDWRWVCARHVEEERNYRSARAVSVPWRAAKREMSAIACLLPPFGDESAGLLGHPCLRT